MNKYESYLLDKDLVSASKLDEKFAALCHKDIVSLRDTIKQYDKLSIPGYKKDFFGNFFRNGR